MSWVLRVDFILVVLITMINLVLAGNRLSTSHSRAEFPLHTLLVLV